MAGLRVGTWNIKGGRGARGLPVLFRRTKYLDRIAEIIKSLELKVVALQEVDVRTLRCGFLHQPGYLVERLSRLTGDDWTYLFAKTLTVQGGAYGNAIISAFPLDEVVRVPLDVPGQRVEKRLFLFARLLIPGGPPCGIGCFHLSVEGDGLRLQQVKRIKAALSELSPPPPLILGGDLNGGRSSAAYQEMLAGAFPLCDLGPSSGYSFTDRSGYRARIDFLYGKGALPLASGIVDSGGVSDHDLVWVECEV